MSLVKIEELSDIVSADPEDSSKEVIQCCDQHFLVNSQYFQDLNTGIRLQQLQIILKEKDRQVTNLEKENTFLRDQVKTLNTLFDQLSTSTRNLSTKNDIRIRVENSSNVTLKWYRRPKVILSGSAIAVLFSIYLRYKIKNW